MFLDSDFIFQDDNAPSRKASVIKKLRHMKLVNWCQVWYAISKEKTYNINEACYTSYHNLELRDLSSSYREYGQCLTALQM